MTLELSGTVVTDAGMLVLWNPQSFTAVVDYDTWEAELLEDTDIERHIAAGSLVPLYIHSDGAYGVSVRAGTADSAPSLTPREQRYLTVSSEPYRFESQGTAHLSGIEYVHADGPDTGISIPLPAGKWIAAVHLIAWDDEPGSVDETGTPLPTALPDVLVLLTPEPDVAPIFRRSVETFDWPEVSEGQP